jgi:hypothetical protein
MLERGLIAPNALFEELNPDIDADYLNIKVGLPLSHIMSVLASPFKSDTIGRFRPNPFRGPMRAFDDAQSIPSVSAALTPTLCSMMPSTTYKAAG